MKPQATATIILNLNSTLKNRVLMSGAFKLAGRAITLVEKISRMEYNEQKRGERKIDPFTGNPLVDSVRVDLEEVLACYGAIMDEGGEAIVSLCSLESVVASRETPFTQVKTNEQLLLDAKCTGLSVQELQKRAYESAQVRATSFRSKAAGILGELESALDFAPDRDIEDIPADKWDMEQSLENAIAKYKAAVAAGKVWDDADKILFLADLDYIEQQTTKIMKAA